MPNKVEPRLLKGFKDYLPEEQRIRQQIIDTCREVFELYGFLQLGTPALEYADILENKIGEDEKLIYKFEDRGEREIALRYDLTIPLARVVSQYKSELRFPFRRFQIGSVWRADKPQKGRYREFIQADADIVGTDNLISDAEAISVYFQIFQKLGITDYKILINSRKIFDALIVKMNISKELGNVVIRAIDKYDKEGLDGVLNYLEENQLDVKSRETVKKYLEIVNDDNYIESLAQFLGDIDISKEAIEDLKNVGKYLKDFGVPENVFCFDPKIARGLDYYTGVVFEVMILDSGIGSVGSGGRYDRLVENFSNEKIPAVGLSVGVDRLLVLLSEKANKKIGTSNVLIMNLGKEYASQCINLLSKLRNEKIKTEYFYDKKDLDKQFKYAEDLNIPFAILIGADEIANDTFMLKNLSSREQESVDFDTLVSKLMN